MSDIQVVVVDDHALFRRGLVSLVSEMDRITVVGEASDGQEALQIIQVTTPDVVLIDVNMPQMDGVETVRALKQQKFKGHILMLTVSRHEEDLISAIKAGADGYLLKNVDPVDLEKSIIHAAEGRGTLSPEVTPQVFKAVKQVKTERGSELLSKREREVLTFVAQGNTTAQIAEQMFISENTVKTHVRHILEKLEAANRSEAVSKAVRLGYLRQGD